MEKKHYLIVGASAAGMAAVETIRAHDPDGRITVLSDEPDPPYFRPMIPFVVSRKKEGKEISLQGRGPYRADGFDLRLSTRAAAIDSRAGRLYTNSGKSLAYDRLLIATGSRPHLPEDTEGLGLDGVFALRTLADARRAAARAETAGHAVMLGGGLLNLKAAFALLERGLKVTLVVRSPEVLSQLMEPEDALLIRDALNRAGLTILTGCSAREIIGDAEGVCGVMLDDGRQLSCRMVCIGKGVRPNVEWLTDSTIPVNYGVMADRYTATEISGVYAAGDVAVTTDPVTGQSVNTGLWTNAVEMGRAAGANMAGRPTVYGGTFGILNATQVARMPFVAMGIVHHQSSDYQVFRNNRQQSSCKLVFDKKGNRLLGALFVGDIAGAGLYRAIIRERLDISGISSHLKKRSLHYGHLLTARQLFGS